MGHHRNGLRLEVFSCDNGHPMPSAAPRKNRTREPSERSSQPQWANSALYCSRSSAFWTLPIALRGS